MAEGVSFGQPWVLLLLVALPGLFLLARKRVAALGRGRGRAVLVLRLLVFSLVACALADPRLLVPDRRLSVVFALDLSPSVPPDQQAAARSWIAQAIQSASPDDHGAVIDFARQAVLERLSLFRAPSATGPSPVLDTSGTDISAALRLAGEVATIAPMQPRVVLVSDGWETIDHAQDDVAWLVSHGVSVSYAPLVAPTSGPEVAVQRIDAPSFVREGETSDITVTLASNVATEGVLTLSEDERPQLQHPVQLSPGSSTVTLRYSAATQGAHVLTADITADQDTLTENNRAQAVLVVKPRPTVLLIDQQAGEGDAVGAALTADRIDVDRRDPSGVPVRGAELSAYEAVVLVDVQATALSLDQQLTLQSYVRDMGHGLLVIGGQNSFSMGAYADTELEKLLPVRASPPDRREQGDLALLLVIDTSGSMSLAFNHVVKMEMAKEAAVQAISELKPTDTVGVLVFNTKYQWVVPPQVVADNGGVPAIQSRISSIKAVGGTDIYTALEAAYQAMTQLNMRFRHVLLLTDGQSPNSSYQSLVSRNQALGITLSTVAIGADADTQLLGQLAQLGNGRSYATQRFDDIPSIVAKETAIASRSSLAEGQFQPGPLDPSPLLSGLDAAAIPKLGGYVQTTARPGATIALTSPRDDPILAHWHYGLGRVVSWMSDAGGLWASDWFAAPAVSGFFPQIVRWSMPAPVDPRLNVSVEVANATVTLTVDSLEGDGSFGDALDTRATVVTPQSDAIEVRLPQVGPGRYQRQFDVSDPGIYQVLFRQVQASGNTLDEVLGVVVDGSIETRSIGTNQALLESLAGQTGGRMLDTPADAFARDFTSQTTVWLPIWPWILTAALVLFPLDVAVRRLRLPRLAFWRAPRSRPL